MGPPRTPLSAETASADGTVVYVVQRDDTLQGIAGRFLGDPAAWPAIFALNRGSARLPDGRTLTHPDLIWPGLPIVLPHAVSGAGPPAATRPWSGRPVSGDPVR